MKQIKMIIGAALLVCASVCNAGFITGTLDNTDDLTILDNGLEFLDVSVTDGWTVNSAVSTYSSDGFRWANYAEVISLFGEFGVDTSGYTGGLWDLTTTDAQENLFSSTLGLTTSSASLGWFDFDGSFGDYFCMGTGCGQGGSFLNDIGLASNSSVGVLLVRGSISSIPEPTSIALLGLGFAGISFLRNKKAA
jgi:hypothetical protein